MKWLFIIWLILVAILICVRMQVHVQWPAITAEAQAVGSVCTITGRVLNPDGTPLANGTVQFNSVVQQTLQGGAVIPPLFKSTNTDPNGNLTPAIALIQGLQGQFTFCSPSAGGCGNPTPVLIPIAATADISSILIGIQLSSGGNVVASALDVTGNATIGGSLQVAGPTTLSSLAVSGPATFNSTAIFSGSTNFNGQTCFADGGCWDTTGIHNATYIGAGGWPATSAVILQAGETAIASYVSGSDALGTNINMDYFSGVHMSSGGSWIADISYPLLFGQVSAASNGAETSWSSYGPQNIGQPVNFANRVQYMALRPNVSGVQAGLFIESGGIDVINGGISANGGTLGTGIWSSHTQNGATFVQSYNGDNNDIGAAAVLRASNGVFVTDLAMTGGQANLGGFFTANRGYVASDAPNGFLVEATGQSGAASALYLSAPNANEVLVIGNQHFGTSNDGVSIPTANAAECGGGGSVWGTSTDTSGSVNVGPNPVNSCVVQFAAAYDSVACVCSTRANTWCSITPSASGFSMGFGANITGYASWICWQNGE